MPGEHAAQTGRHVFAQSGRHMGGIAGRGEGVDQRIADQCRARVEAVLDDRASDALDLVGIAAGGRQDHRFDAMDVVRQHPSYGRSGGVRITIDADQYVACQIELSWIAASFGGAARDLGPGPAGITGANNGAELHPVGIGARDPQHAPVDRANIDRDGRPVPLEIEPRIGAHSKDLTVYTRLAAQHAADHAQRLHGRRERPLGSTVGFAQGAQRPQRGADAEHQPPF